MMQDAFGLELSTDSPAALAAWNATIRSYLEFRLDATDHAKEMLTADPDCAMSHCLRGLLLTGMQSDFLSPKIGEALEEAEKRAGSANPRERLAIEALRALHEGAPVRASSVWDRILVDYPNDLFALRLQHHTNFWMGRAPAMRDAIARVLPAWDETMPGYGFLLGMYCFALEECGDYEKAEPLGREAVERNEDDMWSIHAVAHVLEMQGRLRDGVAWLDRAPDGWDDRNPVRGHLWWHLAMFELERGNFERVFELYDERIRTAGSDFYLDLQNCASLLWRIECRGVDVGERWEELADSCAGKVEDHALSFSEPHHAMALARAGRYQEIDRMVASLEECATKRSTHTAGLARELTIPVCKAVAAYGRGKFEEVTELLVPIRAGYAAMGASHAQRDVFAQLLNEAALRGKQFRLARALLAERVEAKPNSADSWAKYAEALEGCEPETGAWGEGAAANARAQAERCRAQAA